MNYVNFMRKLEGKEPKHEQTTNSETSGARSLDMQGIIEFTRGYGYPERDLEARQGFPDHRTDMFRAGYDGLSFGTAVGLYSHTSPAFFWAGRAYYQQQQGDTHSQQQDTVPVETPATCVRSDWTTYGDNVSLDDIRAITRRLERLAMGGTSPSSQPRATPEGGISGRACYPAGYWIDEQPLRSTVSTEGSGVQGVRLERESSERSQEDTRESFRRSLERGEGWSF
jgi:hypothetical protein